MEPRFSRRSFLKTGAAAAAALSAPLLPAGAAAPEADENSLFSPLTPLRMTQYGPVRGRRLEDGRFCWQGIPYGSAPAGEGRWAAPQEPARWLAVRDCTAPAPMAYQYSSCPAGSEDCLTLDICADPAAEKQPVLVYLHSSFLTGASQELPCISGNSGCVFAALNYRLGLFGWNCLPALTSGPDATGNFALLDLARALDWLRENISRFGGDPSNITLCGFADGGRMAAALAGSERFRGRFQRAIVLSGGLSLADPDASARQLADAFAALAVEDGLFRDSGSAARWLLTPEPAVREWLCGLEPARIAALSASMPRFPCLYADGALLPGPGQSIRSHVPLLLLSSATEFSARALHDVRPLSDAAAAFAVRYGSALCRWSSTEAIAEALAPGSAPVWLGFIDYGGDDSLTPIPGLGSFHGIALALLSPQSSFSCTDLSSGGAQALAARLVRAVSDFTLTGDPGWERWDAGHRTALRLDADGSACRSSCTPFPDSRESIRAAMAADSTLSEDEKETVEQLCFSGFYFQ